MPAELNCSLLPHPTSPATPGESLEVTLRPDGQGGLQLHYLLKGAFANWQLPSGNLDPKRLWAATCFELFVGRPGSSLYREFNFSPTGQWMRFDFSDYRQHSGSGRGPAPALHWEQSPDALSLWVFLPAATLPPGPRQLGITAVVLNAAGQPAYWALAHPTPRPDFHHRGGWTINL
ncbi:DOMON-like domain-containing protein [Zoogloea sp.]|uniref:DOMON-like domain-containing protein n=1 Tax=Zoogloea sp. TaxID=49181 RepID=UPI0035B4E195